MLSRRSRSIHAARLALLAAALLAAPTPGRADGTVVRAKGCGDKIFVSTVGTNFSVLTATGSNSGIADGDLLVGDVEKIGFSMLYDRNAGRSVTAIVEDHQLDRAHINQRIAIACRTAVSSAFANGTVSRANGCGNKIIVNSEKGYAILERLSGGIVAEGDQVSGDFNQAGRATIKDEQTGGILTVFVDDFQLSRSAAGRKIPTLCHR